ncbi:hypothetical protein AX15_001966 [Amanita polypyramis BW_CC]|nr:hypothetical protein AX15_001966 [Amanita polypyramis BW_CC]
MLSAATALHLKKAELKKKPLNTYTPKSENSDSSRPHAMIPSLPMPSQDMLPLDITMPPDHTSKGTFTALATNTPAKPGTTSWTTALYTPDIGNHG